MLAKNVQEDKVSTNSIHVLKKLLIRAKKNIPQMGTFFIRKINSSIDKWKIGESEKANGSMFYRN